MPPDSSSKGGRGSEDSRRWQHLGPGDTPPDVITATARAEAPNVKPLSSQPMRNGEITETLNGLPQRRSLTKAVITDLNKHSPVTDVEMARGFLAIPLSLFEFEF